MVILRRMAAGLAACILVIALTAGLEAGTAIVVTKSGNHTFKVELAETADERAQGLMYRRELGDDAGMLFDFQQEGPVSFWMKNTYVSLDMIFIRADGTVARIEHNTEPLSTKIIPSRTPVRYVLEVVAGTSKRIGLKPGDRVLHAAISGG